MIEQRVEGKVHVYFLGKAYHQEVGEEVAYTKMVGLRRERQLNLKTAVGGEVFLTQRRRDAENAEKNENL